ncbi:MAG: hypothetical protein R3F55_05100 [Alphaproteobacteria bacterium]
MVVASIAEPWASSDGISTPRAPASFADLRIAAPLGGEQQDQSVVERSGTVSMSVLRQPRRARQWNHPHASAMPQASALVHDGRGRGPPPPVPAIAGKTHDRAPAQAAMPRRPRAFSVNRPESRRVLSCSEE